MWGDSNKQNGLINRRYQIMVTNMLKNLSHRYSNHYIIKFVDFIHIYYAINLDVVSSFMIFKNLNYGCFDILQVWINK